MQKDTSSPTIIMTIVDILIVKSIKIVKWCFVSDLVNVGARHKRLSPAAFAVLRQLYSIRRSVTRESYQTGRTTGSLQFLAGLPAYQLDQLQSVSNAAARIIYRSSRCDHVMSLLKDLHWLRVPERIEFKLGALMYKCLNGSGLAYVTDSLQRVHDGRHSFDVVTLRACTTLI